MIRTLYLISVGLILSGCATMTRGANEGVMIESEPPGATVTTDIPYAGQNSVQGTYGCEPTPCAISLPRKRSPVVTVSLDGYDPISFKVTSAVATSSTSLPAGTVVAGIPPGSHVVAGKANFLNRIPVGGRVVAGAVLTYGVGGVVDLATGANKNLSPNPVTVFLAPDGWEDDDAIASTVAD